MALRLTSATWGGAPGAEVPERSSHEWPSLVDPARGPAQGEVHRYFDVEEPGPKRKPDGP